MTKYRGKNGCFCKEKKGSITVEACFLIPFFIMILLLFLWLSLYLHDRVVIRGAMQRLISSAGDYMVYGTLPESGYLSGGNMADRGVFYAVASSEPEKEERMEAYFRQMLSGRLFLCKEKEVRFKKKGCYLILNAEFECPGFLLLEYFMGQESFTDQYEEKCFWTVREEITRIGSVALKLFRQLKP